MRSARIILTISMFCVPLVIQAEDRELRSLIQKLESGKASEKTLAAQTIGELGPASDEAIPALISALKADDAALRHEAAVALGRISSDPAKSVPALEKAIDDSSAAVRYAAIDAIRGFGSKAKAASKTLDKCLDDKDPLIRMVAARTLSRVDRDSASRAVPVLVEGLKSEDEEVAGEAIRALAMIGKPAVKPVVELVGDHHSHACVNACEALAAMGSEGESAVQPLIEVAKSSDPQMRWHAVHALGQIGAAAKPAVPVLVEYLGDKDMQLAYVSEQSLMQIGKPSVPSLIEALKDEKRRAMIIHILGGMGSDASEAVPKLASYLSSDNPELQREAVLALGAIGGDAKSKSTDILKLLDNSKFPFRETAAYALGRLKVAEAVPSLKKTIDVADNPVLQLASVWALVQIDPANDEYIKLAVPHLVTALDNKRPQIRLEAARTLAQLGPKSKNAVSALRKKLTDEDPDVRRESLAALAEIGPASSAAVPDIVKLAEKDGTEVRPLACYALGRIGPDAKSAVPVLNLVIKSSNSHEQAVAAWALVNIAPDKESIEKAIPLLAATVMNSHNPRARLEAVKTLGKIGSGSPLAAQAIKEGVNDPDESVRKVAQAASEKVK